MDWVQWYATALAGAFLFGGLLRLREQDLTVFQFLASSSLFLPLVGRIYGWW